MALFYAPDILSTLKLDEEESNHAIKVLRMKAGDSLQIVDGKGGYYEARISDPNHKRCGVEIVEPFSEFEKRPYHLHIAIAPTKNIERLEWFVEKATEIGIDEITPIICEHSERKIVKKDRLDKIAVSAMKQSKKAYLPVVNEPVSMLSFVSKCKETQKFIAHCMSDSERTDLSSSYKPGSDVVVLIGPEGDFSPAELKESLKYGFEPVLMGQSRLRTETAGVVAVHTVVLLNDMAK